MKVDDLVIEVRNTALVRGGILFARDCEFEANVIFNGVGSWVIRIPGQHHLTPALSVPGAGILVSDARTGVVLFSGPMTSFKQTEATENAMVETLEVSGVTDEVRLDDALVSTDPTVDMRDAENDAENPFYIVTDKAENIIVRLVNDNIGPGALPYRRVPRLSVAASEGRGASITKEFRFPTLLEALRETALPDGLGFRIIQQGETLRFSTYLTSDRSRSVRLSVRNQRLKSSSVQVEPPGVTAVLVSAVDNKAGYLDVTNTAAHDAEALWGRRIERYATGNMKGASAEQLSEVGTEVLHESGFTNIAAQAVAIDHETSVYGVDWNLGDTVTVEIGGEELTSQVTGFTLMSSLSEGLRMGMTLGDASGFNLTSQILKKLDEAARRIAALERVPPIDGITSIPEYKTFNFATPSRTWVCQHAFNQIPVTVTTLDASGSELEGDVIYVSPNQVEIRWFYATSGSARVQR